MSFCAEDLVEIERDREVALGGRVRRRRKSGGGRIGIVVGGVTEELEVGNKALRPFAGGAGGGERTSAVGSDFVGLFGMGRWV